MKKFLYILGIVSLSPLYKAQSTDTMTPAPAPASSAPASSTAPYTDNRKVRFGLRVTPQPTWLSSGDKNNTPNGAKFGFGFGLNLEFRFSEVTALLTGIGGDIEGGKYTFRNDVGYYPAYFLDESNLMQAPSPKDHPFSDIAKSGNTLYSLKERSFSSTYVTIPLILKLSTHEHMGLKYFGMFGGEIAIRMKAQATDTYNSATTFDSLGIGHTTAGPGSLSQININKDSSIPIRVGLNVGIGAEYRIAESTSLFMNINYFRSFINAFQSPSEYIFYHNDTDKSGNVTYKFIQQNLTLSALRINIGIMF